MARIDRLEKNVMARNSVHEPVEATYSVFVDDEGRRYLQIDTYGSAGRQMRGKKSQSVQFGPEAIGALRRILDEL